MKADKERHIFSFISLILLVSCFIFVTYRGYRCFQKYLTTPEIVDISYQQPTKFPFPAFTFCPNHKNPENWPRPFNEDFLGKCNLSVHDYISSSKWLVEGKEDCSNAAKLYENVALSVKDLGIDTIEIVDVKMNHEKFEVLNPVLDWKASPDPSFFGLIRCWTLTLDPEVTKRGIGMFIWTLKGETTLKVYIHGQGLSFTDLTAISTMGIASQSIESGVEIEAMQSLNYKGKECNSESLYLLDQCRLQFINEESTKKMGCTSPYASNLDNVCTNPSKMKQASQIFTDWYFNREIINSCPYPCHFLRPKFSAFNYSNRKAKKNETFQITLMFEPTIKLTQVRLSYTELELIGEFGGYVGLFLGISVLDIRHLFKSIMAIMWKTR